MRHISEIIDEMRVARGWLGSHTTVPSRMGSHVTHFRPFLFAVFFNLVIFSLFFISLHFSAHADVVGYTLSGFGTSVDNGNYCPTSHSYINGNPVYQNESGRYLWFPYSGSTRAIVSSDLTDLAPDYYTYDMVFFSVQGGVSSAGSGVEYNCSSPTPPSSDEIFPNKTVSYYVIDNPNQDYFNGILLLGYTAFFVIWIFKRKV